jgi:hypothetical protein
VLSVGKVAGGLMTAASDPAATARAVAELARDGRFDAVEDR